MTCAEQQQEELEVLESIYDGDEQFKQVSPTQFTYKYGEDGDYKCFMVEITWGEDYPNEPPTVNMNAFYNKHILDSVKENIVQLILEQVHEQDLLDTAMTFTLFEWIKENYNMLTADQPNAPPTAQAGDTQVADKKKEKKEQYSKSQKRKMFDRLDAQGEKPRGYDWVDIVKHLSQIGRQPTE